MKININPKADLFKWGPLEGRLAYVQPFITSILYDVPKHYKWPWPASLCIFDHGQLVWINEYSAVDLVGSKYLKKYFLNLKNYQAHWKKWETWVKKFNKISKQLNKFNFSRLSNEQLHKHLLSFYNLNISFWLIVFVPEFVNIGGEGYFRKKLEKLLKDKTNQYLEILLTPTKLSFLQKEELDLLGLAEIKNKKELDRALKKHVEKYHWVLNGYGGNRILGVDYFKDKLNALLKQKSAKEHIKEIKNTIQKNKAKKKTLIKKLNLNREFTLTAMQLSQSIWWQDLRKSYILQMNAMWDKFLKEIERRTDWKFNELLWCWGWELLDIVKDKKVNKTVILKRANYHAIYSENGKVEQFIDKNFIKKLIDDYLKADVSSVEEIKGLVVSKGKIKKIKGRVKIIKNPFTEAKKMKQGDILVTTMTEPEFIVVMKKAKAVITDQGGLTSHAAIVSRELGVPCIVGTKIATQALKDGDRVEIDIKKGVVKILK